MLTNLFRSLLRAFGVQRAHTQTAGIVACLGVCGGPWIPIANAQCLSPSLKLGPEQVFAGPNGTVYDTVSFDLDGAGPRPNCLIAAGQFTVAGTGVVNNVAAWDGTAWTPIGTGLNGTVRSVAVFNNELYAAGSFTGRGPGSPNTSLNRIAKWDGSAWQPLGVGIAGTGNSISVNALQVYSGRLYAAGKFTSAGGIFANNIASWDGSVWRSLGTGGANAGGGVDGAESAFSSNGVRDLGVFDGLLVGGAFTVVNGTSSLGRCLARFDGTTWTVPWPIAHSVSGATPEVRAIATRFGTSSTDLYIGGDFTSVNGVGANNIARYHTTAISSGPWEAVGTLGGTVDKLLLQSNQTSVTSVYASTRPRGFESWPFAIYRFTSGAWNQFSPEYGTFLSSFGPIIAGVNGVSQRVGNDWLPFGPGLNDVPDILIAHNNELCAFGTFTGAGGQLAGGAARFTGGSWQPIGSGMITGYSRVLDAVSFNGSIFALVNKTSSPQQSAVLRFDGTSWVPTTGGFSSGNNGYARLEVIGADLYYCDGTVAKWNGSGFIPVGNMSPGPSTTAAALFNNELYAFGSDVKKLVGGAWTSFAALPDGMSYTTGVIVWNGRLFMSCEQFANGGLYELVGGTFTRVIPGTVYVTGFTNWNGRLITTTSQGIYVFDGATWSLTTNVSNYIRHPFVFQNDLIGSGIVAVDARSPILFTRLTCCRADFNADGTRNIDDIFIFLNAWFAMDPRTDVDGNGRTIDDIFIFINLWFAGC
jgi:hypothetical protein